jgi:hypothetical protein
MPLQSAVTPARFRQRAINRSVRCIANFAHRRKETMPTVHARHSKGFLVEFDVDHEALEACINWLIQSGYTPDYPSGDGWPTTPSGEPLCPRHGVAMKRRSKQNDTWFSHRVIDPQSGREGYCRGHATGVDGGGFEL